MLETEAKPRGTLDRPTIVKAALRLLDQVGLEGLSTRRLAAELGVKGPSLYWHFKNKDELLSHMSGEMFREALPEPDFDSPDFDWAKWLAAGARGLRKVALSRRDGARVMAKVQPFVSENSRAFDEMTRCLHERSGLSERDAAMTLLALGRYAMGWALYETTAGAVRQGPDWQSGFEYGLQTFLKGIRTQVAESQLRAGREHVAR
jgi:TetR/AcrR family tetracycline transcriptional repressor